MGRGEGEIGREAETGLAEHIKSHCSCASKGIYYQQSKKAAYGMGANICKSYR